MKKGVVERLLVFAIGLPLVLAIPILLPYEGHLAFALCTATISAIGALELNAMLRLKGLRGDAPLAAGSAAAMAMATWAELRFSLGVEFSVSCALIIALAMLSIDCFARRKEDFEGSIGRAASNLFALLYPGALLAQVLRIVAISDPPLPALAFLLMVFGNDSLAYAMGMLVGRRRNVVAVSPSKSIAGFAGGYLASFIVAAFFYSVFPEVLPGPLWKALVLALIVGSSAILGDLTESVLKRSADVKDSGTLMPGRGGILDSVDSVIFSTIPFLLAYGLLY